MNVTAFRTFFATLLQDFFEIYGSARIESKVRCCVENSPSILRELTEAKQKRCMKSIVFSMHKFRQFFPREPDIVCHTGQVKNDTDRFCIYSGFHPSLVLIRSFTDYFICNFL